MLAWIWIEDTLFANGIQHILSRIVSDLQMVNGTMQYDWPELIDLAIVDVAMCDGLDDVLAGTVPNHRKIPPLVLFTEAGGFRSVIPGVLYLLDKRMSMDEVEAALRWICMLLKIICTPIDHPAGAGGHCHWLSGIDRGER